MLFSDFRGEKIILINKINNEFYLFIKKDTEKCNAKWKDRKIFPKKEFLFP